MRLAVATLALTLLAPIASAQTGSNSCAAPDPIAGSGSFPFSTVGATTDGSTAAMCNFFGNSQVYNDVWFCWTADQGGLFAIETCGAGYDTKLAVYADCAPCPLEDTILACNDDTSCPSGFLQSRVTLIAEAGHSYMIRVGAYAASGTGTGSLTIGSDALDEEINPANGHRYVLYATTSWDAAEATAVALGGHLVTINDAEENAWVAAQFGVSGSVGRRIWLGLNDSAVEGQFEWISGEPATYLNWSSGEPNDAGANEDYAEMLGVPGTWNDMPLSGGTASHVGLAEIGAGGSTCTGDLDGDGAVSGNDLATLLGNWSGSGIGDLDGDGLIDGSDLSMMLGSWGDCP